MHSLSLSVRVPLLVPASSYGFQHHPLLWILPQALQQPGLNFLEWCNKFVQEGAEKEIDRSWALPAQNLFQSYLAYHFSILFGFQRRMTSISMPFFIILSSLLHISVVQALRSTMSFARNSYMPSFPIFGVQNAFSSQWFTHRFLKPRTLHRNICFHSCLYPQLFCFTNTSPPLPITRRPSYR